MHVIQTMSLEQIHAESFYHHRFYNSDMDMIVTFSTDQLQDIIKKQNDCFDHFPALQYFPSFYEAADIYKPVLKELTLLSLSGYTSGASFQNCDAQFPQAYILLGEDDLHTRQKTAQIFSRDGEVMVLSELESRFERVLDRLQRNKQDCTTCDTVCEQCAMTHSYYLIS